ncbi:D-alanyl-D-alanine carboxypeptidase family protein [Desulfitobacterium sp.]|uniref:D-alanyl-D-alanine carboxypeptidase family protein n=1 Tax=Desulfitobacterium sp. TaxID=49981 RepID=UPI002B20D567|nr:D-alanyl-D-alanine carboxypeptidase family protein [Desulfitobacterium sp.]MEA4900037.1 D-alanyl-D-alanine carboxypeptidase family protein [Desulfitobacterium sp.]
MPNSLTPQVPRVYKVQPGDSLYKIAKKFGTTVKSLKTANKLTSDIINIGQILKIPSLTLPEGIYRIGSTGPQVKALQSVLVSFGFSIKVDGIYGSKTASVILQLQQKSPPIKADGIYGPKTKASLQTLIDINFHLVSNPTDLLVLVNRANGLPAEYIPSKLVIPNIPFSFEGYDPKKQMRLEAAQALEQLFAKAKQDNISILGVSGYRSYQRQAQIYATNMEISPTKAQFSAPPGGSEHQTGLSMDVTSASNNYQLSQSFALTPEGQWLTQNAPAFGFIIRYPQGKENITGYQAEPWHIRYLGTQVAQLITQQGLTLEEYLGK